MVPSSAHMKHQKKPRLYQNQYMGNICVFTAAFQTDSMKYIYKNQSKLFLVIPSDEMLNILIFLPCQTKPQVFLGPSALY